MHLGRASLIVIAAGMLPGCAGGTWSGRPALTAKPPPPQPQASPQSVALAEQAQRDVEQLRAIQDGARAAAAEPPRETRDGPPQIQWITLPGAEPDDPTSRAARSLHQAALANPVPPRSLPAPRETPGGGVDPPGEPAQPADAPADAPAADPGRTRQLVVDLCAELYRDAAYSDMPLRELLLIAATTMVTPDRALATDALPGLTDRERELLGRMQEHFARMGRQLAETGDPESIVAEIQALRDELAVTPRLALPQVALCTSVRGFGDYDGFQRNKSGHYTFLAHAGQQVVLYVEVEDFDSEIDEQGQWVTKLSQQLVMYSDRDGIPVWRESWQTGVDKSKNRRDDFFMVQVVTLPKALSVGRFQLKIHVRDENSGAEAEAAVEIEMVADPRLVE